MVITLLLVKVGAPLKISPDPAFVPRGEKVRWVFAMMDESASEMKLEWTIYFQSGNPFNSQTQASLIWPAPRFLFGRSMPTDPFILSGAAETPGDYKYGVRVADSRYDKILSDDDPYLIVR